MKNLFKICPFLLVSFFLIFTAGCEKDKDELQWNTSYTKVPEPADVVMYEVNLRTFAQQNSLKAVTNRLSEIKALGVNVIWLMPIYEQGVLNGKGSPYCIKNYTEIDPEYGTMDDLRNLVKKAHEMDMAVLMDWVANHTSWDNDWIENKSWYTQDADGNIVPPIADWSDVADLNFDNMDMREAMINAMKFWLTEANIDGFRCDAADYVPYNFWQTAVSELRSAKSTRLLMLAEGNKQDYFSAGFDLDFGWAPYTRIKNLYSGAMLMERYFRSHNNEINNMPEGKQRLHFLTNHDESAWDKTPIEIFGSEEATLSAFALMTTLGGAQLIYGTQEIGYPTTIPFFSYTNVDWNSNPEFLDKFKQITTIYNSSTVFKRGDITTHNDNADIAYFWRYTDSERILVAVNVRDESKTLNTEAYKGLTFTNLLNNTTLTLDENLEFAPFQYYILKEIQVLD